MTSGYQGYYDSYQYSQPYTYNQDTYSQVTQYSEQPPASTQYQQSTYDQNSQYQSYNQNNDYSSTGTYGTAGYNQNNTQYTAGQYSAQNTANNQYAQTASNAGYGQYVTNNNEASSSYGQSYAQNSFSGNNNGSYSQTPTNYSTNAYSSQATGTKDYNQNSTSVYGQRGSENTGYVQNQNSGFSDNVYGQSNSYTQPVASSYQMTSNVNSASTSGYSQSTALSNDYGQNSSSQYVSGQYGQNQYGQRKENGTQAGHRDTYQNFKFDSQPPPPPPPSHVQQAPRSGNYGSSNSYRYTDSRGTYDRGSRGRGGMDQYPSRGPSSFRGNRYGGYSGQYSQGRSESPRPFNSRGNQRGRYGNQSSGNSRGESRGGFIRPQYNNRDKVIEVKSEEVLEKYSEEKSKLSQPEEKENVPKEEPTEEEDDVPECEGFESHPVVESQPAQQTYVIPPSALTGTGDQTPSPEVEAKLKELMQPLFCRLCSVNLNATSQAQQHYEGKNHTKKVRMFLASSSVASSAPKVTVTETSTNTSTPKSSEGAATGNKEKGKEKSESVPLDEEVYCKICDVSFTSVKQSTQHYQGKNHAKKVRLAAAANISTPSDTVVKGEGSQFECLMCSVHVTSQEQLNMHINGAKHKNKLRLQQRSAGALAGRWCGGEWSMGRGRGGPGEFPGRGGASARGFKRQFGKGNNNWQSLEDGSRNFQPSGPKRPRQDFSNYRTPSGKFYCSCCNVTLNVESQFAQHVASKRHKTNHAVQRNSSSEHSDNH